MAEADPQADVQLELNCHACAHTWASPFDIVSFFWREIDAWAQRTRGVDGATSWHRDLGYAAVTKKELNRVKDLFVNPEKSIESDPIDSVIHQNDGKNSDNAI